MSSTQSRQYEQTDLNLKKGDPEIGAGPEDSRLFGRCLNMEQLNHLAKNRDLRALVCLMGAAFLLLGCGEPSSESSSADISEKEAGAQDPRASSHPVVEKYLLDDMILEHASSSQREIAHERGEISSSAADGLTVYRSKKWRNGQVPVKFDKSITSEQRQMFFSACDRWASAANVICKARVAESNYLYVTDDDNKSCYTDVGAGLRGGRRVFNFGHEWCWYMAGMIHELGHVLGLMHEHQRFDRDQYVSIRLEGVYQSQAYAYAKFDLSNVYGPYDFHSIMHYHQFAYSADGEPVMIAKPPYSSFQNTMGRAKDLSEGDRTVISCLYGL